MAVLGLGLIGAGIGVGLASSGVIAASYLGVSAAAWGWTAGIMAGNLLFPAGEKQNVQGPRISDLSIGTATEGTPIAYADGILTDLTSLLAGLPTAIYNLVPLRATRLD